MNRFDASGQFPQEFPEEELVMSHSAMTNAPVNLAFA
jgi:hypothetical protein